MKRRMNTYDGVYMKCLRGGKIEKTHLGMSSKLQCPILFIKSMYETYPANDTIDDIPINIVVSNGMANNTKYDKCSAKGWITAAHT